MRLDNNQKAFIALLQAGLWEDINHNDNHNENQSGFKGMDWSNLDYQEVMSLAEQQSVVGLITAGMERATDKSVPKVELLQFIGQTLQIEEQNKAMNYFIGVIIEELRKEKIYAVLVKGQGIAQCYERPLWRTSGDVDLLLDEDNYEEAKVFFAKIASSIEQEEFVAKHIGFTVDPWLVELHGHMYFGLSYRVYKVVKEVENEILHLGGVRVWNNDGVDVHLPNADNDIIIDFTHFLGHFCFGGIGLRQLCDMCRLLWVYRGKIRKWQLNRRLKEMGLMSEWKVFAAVAVDWLGMPAEAMPLYNPSKCYKRRAKRAVARILRVGDMGQNNEEGAGTKQPKWKASISKFFHRFGEFLNLMTIFPVDAHRFFINYLIDKVRIGRAKKKNR